MKYLVFANPGEIDPRLITTLGVNVKENANPIGYFGTGLKYAIAIALRLDCTIEIQSGARRFTFERKTGSVRGKTFDFIDMIETNGNTVPMAFTTELGKNWQPWMAYRELYCNAVDEKGTIIVTELKPEPTPGWTHITVTGDAIVSEHDKRHTWLLSSQPIADLPTLSIHHVSSQHSPRQIFYRGIAVGHLDQPSLYTYNIKSELTLTEDRTCSTWDFGRLLAAAFICDLSKIDPLLLRSIMTAREGTYEHNNMDWNWSSIEPTPEFIVLAKELVRTKRALLPNSLRAFIESQIGNEPPTEVEMTMVERKALAKSIAFLARHGYNVTIPISVVQTLGTEYIFAAADTKQRRIMLARPAFAKGVKFLASTLLEEYLHIEHSLDDCSRLMQDYLLEKIITIFEEKDGEPL